jgi:hypothetical protein
MSTADRRARRVDTSVTPQRWFVRHLPANRRRRHAEEERQRFITSVVTRSEVLGRTLPADVEGWSAAAALAWLQEHRNDPVRS